MNATDVNLREQRVPMAVPESHFVNGTELEPPFPAGLETAIFGMGCFWGAENRFWELVCGEFLFCRIISCEFQVLSCRC